MSIYNILFQGELWDIEEEDYYNYFDNITYFKECSEVEIYQYGNAEVQKKVFYNNFQLI